MIFLLVCFMTCTLLFHLMCKNLLFNGRLHKPNAGGYRRNESQPLVITVYARGNGLLEKAPTWFMCGYFRAVSYSKVMVHDVSTLSGLLTEICGEIIKRLGSFTKVTKKKKAQVRICGRQRWHQQTDQIKLVNDQCALPKVPNWVCRWRNTYASQPCDSHVSQPICNIKLPNMTACVSFFFFF